MTNETDNFIRDASRLALTSKEKMGLKRSLMTHAAATEGSPLVSPFYPRLLRRVRFYSMATAALLIVIAMPSAYAAEHSLPGDALYYLKTEVFEPLEETLALGPERRAKATIENAQNRVEEAAVLRRDKRRSHDAARAGTLLSDKAKEAQEEITEASDGDLRRKIRLQKELLTVLESYKVLLESEGAEDTDDDKAIDEHTDAVEDDLRASIESFASLADDEEVLDAVEETVHTIEKRIEATPSEEGRAILEHALTATERELAEGDHGGALEALIFSEQAADVVERIEEIQEATEAREDDDEQEPTIPEGTEPQEGTAVLPDEIE